MDRSSQLDKLARDVMKKWDLDPHWTGVTMDGPSPIDVDVTVFSDRIDPFLLRGFLDELCYSLIEKAESFDGTFCGVAITFSFTDIDDYDEEDD